MPDLHDLSPSGGSHRGRKRVGRGPGSGWGKTSGRGQKGQKSRSGASIPAGFEGGQMPLQRRIPKRGFTPLSRTEYQVVNVGRLSTVDGGDVSPEILRIHGLIRSLRKPVKVLGQGDIDRALNVTAHAVSASARKKIEDAGGTVTLVGESSGSES